MTDPKPDAVELLLKHVPNNWCDPILTGPASALSKSPGEWDCRDIENLLGQVRTRLNEALADPEIRKALVREWASENPAQVIDTACEELGFGRVRVIAHDFEFHRKTGERQ